MDNCSMKTGFFFLRDCDFPAREQCIVCGRHFCNKHLKIQRGSNAPICLDCLGKEMQENKNKTSAGDKYDDDCYDSTWSYGYRHSYYRNSHYAPWYMGDNDNHAQIFDEHDVRSFDKSPDNDNDGSNDDFDSEASTFDS